MASTPLHDLIQDAIAAAAPVIMPTMGALGPLFRRPMRFPDIGSIVRGHKHNFDHVTVLFTGSVLVRFHKDGEPVAERVFSVKDFGVEILIMADTWHEFIALEPNTFAVCYFPHRGADGGVVADYNGNLHAYA